MPDINITVAHKVAVSDTQSIVCDNSDYTVHWTLDAEWSAYDTKTMRTIYMDGTFTDKVFSGAEVELPVCTVPGVVQIGLFAGDIRTSRVAILRALPSVRSAAGAPADPTPDVYDQLMELIKGMGGASQEDIAKAVADYLAAHPIEETDPTVPEWAKAETKPTYSAAEVGAIAQSDLQATTNAALAQAKASGEFDGPAGPQGPAGTPGKDGAGMDVTGATVGQIAKIAAVDESGVPTAWSPVDMPSGGVSGDVTNIITYPVAQRYEVSDYYKYVSYTQATLNADGTLNESGIGFTTDYLPVIPGETLFLSTNITAKVAFFSKNKDFIGQITVASGQTNYTVPENAALARFQNQYNGGSIVPFECREKPQQGITRLKDLIFSPLHSSVDLLVTGDSNTYGYGLSDRENEGWAYLFAKMLATITEIHVGYMSPYAHAVAYSDYASSANFRAGSRLAIYTDAQSVTLNYGDAYSETWKWYVNDVEQAEAGKTISGLGDDVKKVEVRFTGGQTVNPNLSISKTITVTNKAVVGCGTDNCPIEAAHDWLVLMIGTNNRGVGGMVNNGKEYLSYAGKGTFIVPFPNRKTDASYVASQSQVYGELTSTLRSINYEICDASDFGYAFIQDDSLYQSDMIHYSAKGHKAIANIVGGKLGFPATAL